MSMPKKGRYDKNVKSTDWFANMDNRQLFSNIVEGVMRHTLWRTYEVRYYLDTVPTLDRNARYVIRVWDPILQAWHATAVMGSAGDATYSLSSRVHEFLDDLHSSSYRGGVQLPSPTEWEGRIYPTRKAAMRARAAEKRRQNEVLGRHRRKVSDETKKKIAASVKEHHAAPFDADEATWEANRKRFYHEHDMMTQERADALRRMRHIDGHPHNWEFDLEGDDSEED